MLTRLDHLVILVRDLDRAVRGYEGLGFAVTPGGEHADGLTRNTLIPFKDGSYLELVAFVDQEDPRDNVWGWRRFLSSGGGLIDYCAASDVLAADVGRLGELDFGVDGPEGGGRRLPDGREIRWLIARIRQEGRLLPFLIEDLTPHDLRVPGGSSAEHPNGALGIGNLKVAAPEAEGALRALATLTGSSGGIIVVHPSSPLGYHAALKSWYHRGGGALGRRGAMLTRLDHLVIQVRNLDRAVRGYEDLGVAVTPGGEHADGLTRNALI
ncbi:MAG: VOC family protein, partial [Actinomycetota bacterium]|nr:VOC family protein [Actinomycetota bacterium]